MRSNVARLTISVVLATALCGCQSGLRWDWWRSASRSTPSSSAIASQPPTGHTPLPSATAQTGAANPYAGYGGTISNNTPNAIASQANGYSPSGNFPNSPYPTTNYPPNNGTLAGAGATQPPGGVAPVGASQNADPAGAYPGAMAAYNGAAVPAVEYPQGQSVAGANPASAAANGMAPQAGPYDTNYNNTAAATGTENVGDRYGNAEKADRYAAPANTYDTGTDRYAAPANTYNAPSNRYGDSNDRYANPTDRYAAPQDRYADASSGDRYAGSQPAAEDRYASSATYRNAPPATAQNSAASSQERYSSAHRTDERYGGGITADPFGTTPYTPGSTTYQPGKTGYNPPNVPQYESPGGDRYAYPGQPAPATQEQRGTQSASDTDANGEFRPGSTKTYNSSGSSTEGSNPSVIYPAGGQPANGYPSTDYPPTYNFSPPGKR